MRSLALPRSQLPPLPLFSFFSLFLCVGASHRVLATKGGALSLEPEAATSAQAFVDMVATAARLDQGWDAVQRDGGRRGGAAAGGLAEWLIADVKKVRSVRTRPLRSSPPPPPPLPSTPFAMLCSSLFLLSLSFHLSLYLSLPGAAFHLNLHFFPSFPPPPPPPPPRPSSPSLAGVSAGAGGEQSLLGRRGTSSARACTQS